MHTKLRLKNLDHLKDNIKMFIRKQGRRTWNGPVARCCNTAMDAGNVLTNWTIICFARSDLLKELWNCSRVQCKSVGTATYVRLMQAETTIKTILYLKGLPLHYCERNLIFWPLVSQYVISLLLSSMLPAWEHHTGEWLTYKHKFVSYV